METTSSTTTPGTGKKGFSRIWKKFRSSFSDKEGTPANTPAPIRAIPKEEPQPGSKSEPIEYVLHKINSASLTLSRPEPQPDTVNHTIEVDIPGNTDEEAPMQNDVNRRLEKARALFKKYDFDIDESEWTWEENKSRPTERVQKTIRMRVKYTCHSCNTIFGHDKICISCQHPRCNKCVRYPPKKPKVKKEAVASPLEEQLQKGSVPVTSVRPISMAQKNVPTASTRSASSV